MNIVDSCRCGRHHRNAWYFARCRWPEAAISGRGQVAIVVACAPARVVLVERLRWGHVLFAEFATFGCSATCRGEHELVALDHDGPQEAA